MMGAGSNNLFMWPIDVYFKLKYLSSFNILENSVKISEKMFVGCPFNLIFVRTETFMNYSAYNSVNLKSNP